jgi:hypothetical protein
MQIDFQFTLFEFRMYHIPCELNNQDRSEMETGHHWHHCKNTCVDVLLSETQ